MSPRPRVVLYQPQCEHWTLPLALVALGSSLDRSRFDVHVVDARLERDPTAALLRALEGPTVCLGVTALTGSPLRDALRATRAAHQRFPSLPIVWGGWHPSLFPMECLAEPGVRATVVGQGERTFAELLERFAEGRGPEGVRGCAHREGGAPTVEPPRAMEPLDGFPAQDFGLLDVERYFRAKGRRQLDFVTSQGCRFRCTFCADPYVYKRGWTGLSAPRLGEELEHLWRRYRFEDLNLQDETYFTHRPRVVAVCEELLRRGLRFTWAATMRGDQGSRLTEQEWALCKRAGLRRVLVGVEAGSQQMLDWLEKDLTLEQIYATAEKMVRHGVAGVFPFIVGFPGETEQSVEATLACIKKLRRWSPSFEVALGFYQPYPGSPIAELAWKSGYPRPQSLDQWATFDFEQGRTPWVSPERYERVRRFSFYQRHAYGAPRGALHRPLRWLSRARVERDFYRAPVEKLLLEAWRAARSTR